MSREKYDRVKSDTSEKQHTQSSKFRKIIEEAVKEYLSRPVIT